MIIIYNLLFHGKQIVSLFNNVHAGTLIPKALAVGPSGKQVLWKANTSLTRRNTTNNNGSVIVYTPYPLQWLISACIRIQVNANK